MTSDLQLHMMNGAAPQILHTCNELLNRKTPNDAMDAHPSNIEAAAQLELENVQHVCSPPASPPPPGEEEEEEEERYGHHPEAAERAAPPPRRCGHHLGAVVVERAHHGGGWLLSGLVCMNVLMLGGSFVAGGATSGVITAAHQQIFLIVLMLLAMLWMVVYLTFTSRRDEVVRDGHAGPVWLRVGLVLFGVLSLLMDLFKIVTYVGFLHCDSAVKVAFPVVQVVFLLLQTYFLWTHAKDCVQLHTNFTRCGLTLTLSTNLVLWMAAVTEESIHQTEVPLLNTSVSHKMYRASYGDQNCKCSHSVCDTFKEAFYYMYPFNIEYSLFASAMAYVMWKNVGRLVDNHHHHHHHRLKFRPKDVCVGPVAGVLVALAGLVTFVLYEVYILREERDSRDKALLIHFVSNIVIVSLMSASAAVGCVVYRLDQREHVSEKNPTRTLDMGLLVGASMGQLVISYFSIVALVATGARGHLNALGLTWAVLVVLQLGLQNYFLIEGLHREPYHVMQEAALHTNAHFQEQSVVPETSTSKYFLNSCSQKLSWKRRVLKEVCAFLLLGNIILWIMPAFGARPQFDHPSEMRFYRFTMWAAIVNVGLPFGIFYRMHSVASLFEVYLTS